MWCLLAYKKNAKGDFRWRLRCASELKWCFLVLVALVVSAAGCGGSSKVPPRASVSGEVQMDEAPLPAGIIRFVPIDGTKGPVASPRSRRKKRHCRLSYIEGPVLGKNAIEIVPTVAENPIAGATDIKAAWTAYAKAKAAESSDKPAPKKLRRNPLPSVVVTAAGKNTFDFKLAGK